METPDENMVHVACPGCGATYNVPASQLGGTIGCSVCGARVPVVRRPPPPPGAAGEPDEAIPTARPVRPWAKYLLIAALVGLVLAGAAVGVVALLPDELADRRLVAEATALADAAHALATETLADANDLEALDDQTLLEKRKAMDRAVEMYRKAAGTLTKLAAQYPRDHELAEIADAVRLRVVMAEEQRHRVAEALWPGPGPLSSICERVSPAVVWIGTGEGNGSGFLIEHGGALYVATNRHVVEHAGKGLEIVFPIGGLSKPKERRTVKVGPEAIRYVHRWVDLAVISMVEDVRKKYGVHPLKLLPEDANFLRLEAVWAMGFPSAGRATFPTATTTEGTVSNIEFDAQGTPKLFQMSASINPGNSGGPVFNARGRVVGISTWIRRRNERGLVIEGQNFAVHIRQLRNLLTEPQFSVGPDEIARLLDPDKQLPKDLTKVTDEFRRKGYALSAAQPFRSPRLVRLMRGMATRKSVTLRKSRSYRLLALYAQVKKLKVGIFQKNKLIAEVDESEQTIYRYADFTPPADGRYDIRVLNPTPQNVGAILVLFEKPAEPPATQSTRPATGPTRQSTRPAAGPATRKAAPASRPVGPETRPGSRREGGPKDRPRRRRRKRL